MIFRHTRILEVPQADSLNGAYLEDIRQEFQDDRRDVVIDYLELRPESAQLELRGGRPYETIQGLYIPRRLRLWNVRQFKLDELYSRLDSAPIDHPGRSLRGSLFFRAKAGRNFFLLFSGMGVDGLVADGQVCIQEKRVGDPVPMEVTRDWSPAPASPARLVPDLQACYRRYGGNPVPIHLGKRLYNKRLFIGSLDMQSEVRPDVSAVLNLGEEPSSWFNQVQAANMDRWFPQGEGSLGMNLVEIAAEADWVLGRLQHGQRVLVHCVAGMNRSSTIGCAVLIRNEGLSAEEALKRVRRNHPWARPDSFHWLRLRWMAQVVKQNQVSA